MSLTNTIAAKLGVAFVAVAMAFAAFAPAASAQSTEDLQQMINDLLAQVAQLQGQLGQGGDSMAAGVCPYTWTRDLSSGSTGMDVMKLQQFLNADPDTRVAVEGAGSAGQETEYYGPATAAAVSKMQVKYRSEILSPANLVNPTGFFGPSSRDKANALCVAAPASDSDDDGMMDDDDDDGDDRDSGDLSGEASLKDAEIDDPSDDDIEEGVEDAEIGSLTVEFEDGDAEVSRVDIGLLGNGQTDTTTVKPWDAFETISIWVDGDKIAEKDADDEDEYLDEDKGSLRFSGLDLFAMEDEEVEIVVAATIQNNLDSTELTDWDLRFLTMRYFDGEGVATTDTDTKDIESDSTGPTSDFTIETEGSEDELIIKTSSNDPDSTTLQLEENSKSDWYTLFVFDIDTDDSVNDIEIDKLPVTVAVSSSTVGTIVDDLELVIDGTTVTDFDWENTTDSASRVAIFDVDKDVAIDAGDRVEAELMVRFNSLATGNEGITASGSVAAANTNAIQAEGADDLASTPTDQLRGAAEGDDHTLRTSGIDVSPESTDADVTVNDGNLDDYGTFKVEVEVTAFEQDVYIAVDPATSITYQLEDSSGTAYMVPAASSSVVLTSTADEGGAGNAFFEITEGETETLTLTVTYTPVVANRAARLLLSEIKFDDSGTAGTGDDKTQTTLPASDYRTDVITMVN